MTTVAGNQTLEKTTANAIRVLELAGRATSRSRRARGGRSCASRASRRTSTARPGSTAPTCRRRASIRSPQHAVDFLAERLDGATLVADRPAHERRAAAGPHPEARPERIVLMGGAIAEGNVTPAAEFNIWADPEAARASSRAGST